MAIRSEGVPGLIFTPDLTSDKVTSLTMTFEPSIGIMARRVDKLGMDIRSFREPLKRAIKEVVIPSIAQNFHKHGRPRWAPLTTETVEQKGHAIPLVRSGALKKTMGLLNIWHIDTEKALLANLPESVWYGVVHQMGTGGHNVGRFQDNEAIIAYDPLDDRFYNAGAEGAIPARPFVMLQEEDEQAIDEIFLDWLDERALHAGWPTTARSKILSGDF